MAASSIPTSADTTMTHLVLDSGAIISGANLTHMAQNYWTIPEVLEEIRDRRAREVLETLPFTLKTKEPSAAALKFVTDFARQTGDIRELSRTDIKVLALTYQLEVEATGGAHLRKEPVKSGPKVKAADTSVAVQSVGAAAGSVPPTEGEEGDFPSLGGPAPAAASAGPRAASSRPVGSVGWAALVAGNAPAAAPVEEAKADTVEGDEDEDEDDDEGEDDGEGEGEDEGEDDGEGDDGEDEEGEANAEADGKTADAAAEQASESAPATTDADAAPEPAPKVTFAEPAGGEPATSAAPASRVRYTGSRVISAAAPGSTREFVTEAELEGGNWVTPESMSAGGSGIKFGSAGKSVVDKGPPPPVGCVTVDFAMQNVLLHIGLALVSLQGRRITKLKQWVLKCDSCYRICTTMTAVFCPHCGNPTLARLGVTVGKNGKQYYHYKTNRKINTRGTKFSLPAPKGGRDGDLLLREDQLLMGVWRQRAIAKEHVESLFAEPSTKTFGAHVLQGKDVVVGYGKTNPNARRGRERRGQKKKNQRR